MQEGIMASIVSVVASLIMILGSVGGYIPQYIAIHRTRKAGGFSMLVSFALITANTIRIYFWCVFDDATPVFAKPFDTTLLIQAYAVVIFQLALVQVCIRAHNFERSQKSVVSRRRRFSDFQLKDFWAWDDFSSYIYCFLTLNMCLIAACTTWLHKHWFGEMLGVLALGVEAMLAVPQAYRNHKKQSVDGLSKAMVISWAVGDAYKIVYYIVSGVPFQFLYCGVFQFLTDTFILLQIFVLFAPGASKSPMKRWLR